jgi:tricorn protease-like protein
MPPAVAGRPFVNVKAFVHQGELAFISRNVLWVLSGPQSSLRPLALPKGLTSASPTFSADGKWLAYLGSNVTSDSGSSSLWIARADGTDAHQVLGLPVSGIVGWSSTTDMVAVTTNTPDPLNPTIPWPTAISLVSVTGTVSTLAADDDRERGLVA